MTAFKQFIKESTGPLLELILELHLQKKFGLTKDESKDVAAWVNGEHDESLEYLPVWDKIIDYYSDTIPEDILKNMAADYSVGEWVYETLLHDLKNAGIETHFQPYRQERPRDNTQELNWHPRFLD